MTGSSATVIVPVVIEFEVWTVDNAGLNVGCCVSHEDDVKLAGASVVFTVTLVATISADEGTIVSPIN